MLPYQIPRAPALGDDSGGSSFGSVLMGLALVAGVCYVVGKLMQTGPSLNAPAKASGATGAPETHAEIMARWTTPPARKKPPGRAELVKVVSQFTEDEDEDLNTAANTITKETMRSLQKQIRTAGFKGAEVWGYGKGHTGGFVVGYDGQEYKFLIDEDD